MKPQKYPTLLELIESTTGRKISSEEVSKAVNNSLRIYEKLVKEDVQNSYVSKEDLDTLVN